MSKIRTRFAPSPTGFLHIGSLRTALFDYLLAKSRDGDFVLRIEDTDQKRKVEGATENLINILNWLGLKFDEGPGMGGEYGPYIQTERIEIYDKYIKKLLDNKKAYHCFCSEDRLKKLRDNQVKDKKAPRYDNRCRELSGDEVGKKIKSGTDFVIRQKMPVDGVVVVGDELRGRIEFDSKELEDQVLIKSNGIPTYQFASVVDDHLMSITHVIRGSEWIPSLPKNVLLYKAFDWRPPKFIHMPLTLSADGGKLSKRHGDVTVEDYKKNGYLPEALINFSALLGWHPRGDKEIFTLDELVKEFSVNRMGVSAAVFDIKKLQWINGEHIRLKSEKEFHNLALPYYNNVKSGLNLNEISKILHKRVDVLSDIPGMIDFLNTLPSYKKDLFINSKMKTDEGMCLNVLSKVAKSFDEIKEWTEGDVKTELLKIVEDLGLKNGQVLWPVRIAISGMQFTPGGAFEIANILGKDESIKRINIGIDKLKK